MLIQPSSGSLSPATKPAIAFTCLVPTGQGGVDLLKFRQERLRPRFRPQGRVDLSQASQKPRRQTHARTHRSPLFDPLSTLAVQVTLVKGQFQGLARSRGRGVPLTVMAYQPRYKVGAPPDRRQGHHFFPVSIDER